MAHVMKINKGAVGHLSKHYERMQDDNGEYIKFGNQDIDTGRTVLNYNLAPMRESQGTFIKNRCNEVYCLNRKDVNVACSWIVTLPKDFLELNKTANERDFFKGTYTFLENRYGKENIVSAYVHMDETQPHMHFCFVPVVLDKKKGRYKVSAKECINRHDLQTFHEDLQQYLLINENLLCNILNGSTREGNKSIEELKRGSASKELLNTLTEVQIIKGQINTLENDKRALNGQIDALEGKILSLQEVKSINVKKTITGALKGISFEDISNLKRTAERVAEIDKLARESENRLHNAEQLKIEADKIMVDAKRLPMKDQMERLELKRKLVNAEEKSNQILVNISKALDYCPQNVVDIFVNAFQEVTKEQRGLQTKENLSYER